MRGGCGRVLRRSACVLLVLASGCASLGRDAMRFQFPPLPLEPGEAVVAVDASVECDTQLQWRPLPQSWTAVVQTRDGVSLIQSRLAPAAAGAAEHLPFTDADGRLPTLLVVDADDDCGLWSIELEVRKPVPERDDAASDVLLLDYASHGLWYRHSGASLE